MVQFWLKCTCIILNIYYDNHCKLITCTFLYACKNLSNHFIDCLGFFFGQTFYAGHRNSPVYSLAFNSTSLFVALDVQVKTLNFSCYKWFQHFIVFKNTEELKVLTSDKFPSAATKWNWLLKLVVCSICPLNDIVSEILCLWFNCLRVKLCTLCLWIQTKTALQYSFELLGSFAYHT